MEKEQEPRESVSSETREEEKQRAGEGIEGDQRRTFQKQGFFFSQINKMYIVFSQQWDTN